MQYVIINSEEKTNSLFGKALAAGCGGKTTEKYIGGPWAGFGSPQTWDGLQEARRKGVDFYYGDHAYFGRGVNYRVTKNAYQHTGFGEAPDLERLKPYYEHASPFKKTGKNIIVCPQSQNFHDRMGETNWLDNVLAKLKMATDRKIIVRRKNDTRPLAVDLQDAWCLISHTSNAAVEALMAGVPVISTGDCPASKLGLSDVLNVEYPFYPDVDRMAWAGVLAANQWTLAEIAAGDCWKKIQ